MPNLWNEFLSLVQSLNDRGGNFASIHIRQPVLDAIDPGAVGDPSLAALRDRLPGLQDRKAFSQPFEAF
jgi:hypothetical protein